jgi:hypothetical protein
MTEDDEKHHAADVIALAFAQRLHETPLSQFAEAVLGRGMQDWQREVFDALSRSPEVFVLHRPTPDGGMHSEVYGQGVVYIGIDLAADDDRTVYALDRGTNMYADPDPAEVAQAAPPRKPSHRSSQLDRLAQSRAAKAAMFARTRR